LRLVLPFLLFASSALSCPYAEVLADSIYVAEGKTKARKPYGVLSIPVRDEAHARRITLNSIRNNWKRWEKAGKPGDFVSYMAARWVPKSVDPVGHRNWVRNVRAYLIKHHINPDSLP